MKLLLNDKEIARFLIELVNVSDACKHIEFNERHTAGVIQWVIETRDKPRFNLEKHRAKIKQKIHQGVRKDLKAWMDLVNQQISNHKEHFYKNIHRHIDILIDRLGEEQILELYRSHPKQNFIKTVGLQIDPDAEMVRRKHFDSVEEDCLFRNMEGNEELLLTKMDNNLPFWFIDTGYTNFLNGKKKTWHRLTRNHLHHYKNFEAPVDRLSMFEFFPQQWRKSGEKILVIEPGSFSARTFKVDVAKWKQDVEREIRQYSDKPIVFREKYHKKIRTSLYNHLCDEDYHCVININSNSAVEAIWAGIPAITLATHITNPVSGSSISQINNLPKPHLANWLCMLSYSQFTYEELTNGVATRIIKRYYE